MSQAINTKVKVEFYRLADDPRIIAVRVGVQSTRKPELWATHLIDTRIVSAESMEHHVGIAAGAAAEHLCGKYYEDIDPAQAVDAAKAAFRFEAREYGAISRDMMGLRTRMGALLSKLQFLANRPSPGTTPERAERIVNSAFTLGTAINIIDKLKLTLVPNELKWLTREEEYFNDKPRT